MNEIHNDQLPPDEKLMKARSRLIGRDAFYGHLSMGIDWVRSEMLWAPVNCRTMGVRIKADRRIELVWSPTFIANQTMHEVCGAIMHELEHIVHLHTVRGGHRDPKIWNVAADMTVNGTKHNPLIGYLEDNGVRTLPLGGNIIFRPSEQEWSSLTTEQLYEKINQRGKQGCPSCGGKGKQKGSGKNAEGEPCPTCGGAGEISEYGTPFDDHSTWEQSEVSPDEARQIVREAVREAVEKSRGKVPGHLLDAIEKLNNPIVPWRQILRNYLGKNTRGRRTTWSRVHRRRDEFGIKGVSHHATGDAVVIVDTSGSISQEELEQFFAEIEAMLVRIQVSVLLWDAAFQGFWRKYRRYDYKTIKISGRGGTDMAKPIDWLIENELMPRRGPIIMLTDGHCNWHEKIDIPYIAVITAAEGSQPDWGEVVRLKEKPVKKSA